MNRITIMSAIAAMTLSTYSNIITNAVDVYDIKAVVRTPVIKLAEATETIAMHVYRDIENRTLKGSLVLVWVKDDGNDFETVIPSLSLHDEKNGMASTVEYAIEATPFDISIFGKGMKKASMMFVGVDGNVDPDNDGYSFLEFTGFGYTSNGDRVKIDKVGGKVAGMYSCGFGEDSPSFTAQSRGHLFDDAGTTPFMPCDGTWIAKRNDKLSR